MPFRCLLLLLFTTSVAADDFAELIAAERSFAAQAQRDGARAAFIANFSEDNLGFRPGPVMGRALWQQRAEAPFTLEWAPTAAEIAASGDFGYTFGPWKLTPHAAEGAQPSGGHFLSVWERDAEGRFRTVLDHGIEHERVPLSENAQRRGPASPAATPPLSPSIRNSRLQALVMVERELAAVLAGPQGIAHRRDLLTADIAWLRSGALPAQGLAAEPTDGAIDAQQLVTVRMADSGDLAVSAGWNGDAAAVRVYIRIWRHDGTRWRLALDYLERPVPAR